MIIPGIHFLLPLIEIHPNDSRKHQRKIHKRDTHYQIKYFTSLHFPIPSCIIAQVFQIRKLIADHRKLERVQRATNKRPNRILRKILDSQTQENRLDPIGDHKSPHNRRCMPGILLNHLIQQNIFSVMLEFPHTGVP
jgi:hypothetical protein